MTNAVSLAQQASTGVSQGFKNRIINGAMTINQRGASGTTSVLQSATFMVDRWYYYVDATGYFNWAQNLGSVTPPAGFINYLGFSSTGANPISTYAGQFFTQNIEGNNIADLGWGTANAKNCTLSFWVRSSLTGTFGGVVNNAGSGGTQYPFSYTISAANTWTYITIPVTGPTSGTFATNTSSGIGVTFSLGAGGLYVAPTANVWSSGTNYVTVTGATQVCATNGATWYVTGVQFEVGSSATSFDTRPYTTELLLCQRYYARITSTQNNGAVGCGVARSSTAANVYIKLPVTMRTIPTVPTTSTLFLNYNSDVYTAVVSDSGIQGGPDSINFFPNTSSGTMTTGYPAILAIGSGGHIAFQSEL